MLHGLNIIQFSAFLSGFIGLLMILRHQKARYRISAISAVAMYSGIYLASFYSPFAGEIIFKTNKMLFASNATLGIQVASGDKTVDDLLASFEHDAKIKIDFPILVLKKDEFDKKVQIWAGEEFKVGPTDAVGFCAMRTNGTRSIYLLKSYIDGAPKADIAKLIAHELGHCIYFLPHEEDESSFMSEYVETSSHGQKHTSVAWYFKKSEKSF